MALLEIETMNIQRRLRMLLNTKNDLDMELKPYSSTTNKTMMAYKALNAAFDIVISREAEQLVILENKKIKEIEKGADDTNENTSF